MFEYGLFRERTPEERARAHKASDLALKWRLRVWKKRYLDNPCYCFVSELRDRVNGLIFRTADYLDRLARSIMHIRLPEIDGENKKRLTTRSYQFGRKLMERHPPTDFDPNGPKTSIGGEILSSNYLSRAFTEALETKVSYDKISD